MHPGDAIDVPAFYLSGQQRRACVVRFAPAGVALFFGKKSGGYPWDQIRRIDFDDPGRTRANVGAILAFGVLGLASRQAFCLITVSTLTEDLFFENDAPVASWRASASRITEIAPVARGRVFLGGQPIAEASAPPAAGAAAPGWYRDPLGIPQLRWFDGANWTDHTVPDPHPAV